MYPVLTDHRLSRRCIIQYQHFHIVLPDWLKTQLVLPGIQKGLRLKLELHHLAGLSAGKLSYCQGE
jgi:hypothetical protein